VLLFVGAELSPESRTLASLQAQHGVSWRLARKKVEVEGKQLCFYKGFGARCREGGTVGTGKSHTHVSHQL